MTFYDMSSNVYTLKEPVFQKQALLMCLLFAILRF